MKRAKSKATMASYCCVPVWPLRLVVVGEQLRLCDAPLHSNGSNQANQCPYSMKAMLTWIYYLPVVFVDDFVVADSY